MDNKIQNEYDMLKGNINRMCTSDTTTELRDMYNWAKKRLENLYLMNFYRIDNNTKGGEKND
jgi:hypothetical protein